MGERFDPFWRDLIDSSSSLRRGLRFCFDQAFGDELLEDRVERSCPRSPSPFGLAINVLNDFVAVDWFLSYLVKDVVSE